MWVLLIITVYVIGGAERSTKIAEFQSKEDCVTTMTEVHQGMVTAYPNEREYFRLECVPVNTKAL